MKSERLITWIALLFKIQKPQSLSPHHISDRQTVTIPLPPPHLSDHNNQFPGLPKKPKPQCPSQTIMHTKGTVHTGKSKFQNSPTPSKTNSPTPNLNEKPRGFMQSCFPFLCILNVVVIFNIFFINVQLL